MNEEFHYYTVAVLARAAGFSGSDAVTLAYASQYVDDATEGAPLRVGETFFDPVRSAYLGPFATSWAVQKRIYIPFHFIPPQPMAEGGPLRFITEAGSAFARALVAAAATERREPLRLCRLGVALHTLADSWAHQGFSGRHHPENDVEELEQEHQGQWRHLRWANVAWDFLPDIGHAEAGDLPDLAWARWRYRKSGSREVVERDNPTIFLQAGRALFGRLRQLVRGGERRPLPWRELRPILSRRFADPNPDAAARHAAWRREYLAVFGEELPAYDRYAWRAEALAPAGEEDVRWDDFRPDEFRRLAFPGHDGFLASRWVAFHRAALRQRHFVLERLP